MEKLTFLFGLFSNKHNLENDNQSLPGLFPNPASSLSIPYPELLEKVCSSSFKFIWMLFWIKIQIKKSE